MTIEAQQSEPTETIRVRSIDEPQIIVRQLVNVNYSGADADQRQTVTIVVSNSEFSNRPA